METTSGKVCTGCNTWKAFEAFYRNRSQKDGYNSYCKPCWIALNNASRAKHIDKRRAKSRETATRFRTEHADLHAKRFKEWYEKQGANYYQEWQKEHRESVRASVKKWRATHPLAVQVSGNNTRARRAGVEGVLTVEEWEGICKQHDNKCACCGKGGKLEIEHIVPMKLGGSNTVDNIQPLCHGCNTRKKQQHTDYRKKG